MDLFDFYPFLYYVSDPQQVDILGSIPSYLMLTLYLAFYLYVSIFFPVSRLIACFLLRLLRISFSHPSDLSIAEVKLIHHLYHTQCNWNMTEAIENYNLMTWHSKKTSCWECYNSYIFFFKDFKLENTHTLYIHKRLVRNYLRRRVNIKIKLDP